MYKDLNCSRPDYLTQILNISYKQQGYYPYIINATLDLDRPTGEKKYYKEHIHDVYHLILYTKNHGQYTKNGVIHEAVPGTMAITSPGERHDFYTYRRDAVYSAVTLVYETPRLENLTLKFEDILSYYVGRKIVLQNESRRLDERLVREFRLHVVDLIDYLQNPSVRSYFQVHQTLLQIFGFIIMNLSQIEEEQDNERNYEMQKIKQLIETQYVSALTVDALAEQAMMSRGHFLRQFKKAYGISPIAYQQEVRIKAAQNLLRATNMSCSGIARRVGYENVSLFHRLFKKEVGVTPNQFRAAKIRDFIPPQHLIQDPFGE